MFIVLTDKHCGQFNKKKRRNGPTVMCTLFFYLVCMASWPHSNKHLQSNDVGAFCERLFTSNTDFPNETVSVM